MSFLAHKTMKKLRQPPKMDSDKEKRLAFTRALAEEIVIQIPHRPSDGIHPKNTEMLIKDWVSSGISYMPFRDSFGGMIELLRNSMVHAFLTETKRKYLIMLDNDVVPKHPASVLELASHNLPVVSAVVPAYRPDWGTFIPVAFEDDTGVSRFPTTAGGQRLPAEGLVEASGCGTGFLCIRRDVLEAIKWDWFTIPKHVKDEAVRTGNLRKTEDISFCEKVRKAGFSIHGDFSCQAWHDKTVVLSWPDNQIDYDLPPEDFEVTREGIVQEVD